MRRSPSPTPSGLTPVSTIRNLGRASEAEFAAAGIHSAEALRDMGADAAYLRLLDHGARPHFIVYYALVLGLQGRLWTDCGTAEKAELRLRFDALKARAEAEAAANGKGRTPMDAALDALGVIPLRDQPTSSRPEKKNAIS